MIQRRAAYLIAVHVAGSKATGKEEKFWPITEVKKPNQPTKEEYKRMINRYNLKLK